MKGGHKPNPPRSPLGAIQPLPMDTEAIKAAAWNEQGILIVSINDDRISWTDAEFLKQIGRRIYGEK